MPIFDIFFEVDGVESKGISRGKFTCNGPIFFKATPYCFVYFLVGDLSTIGDRSMEVVGMRRSPLNEEEGNVGNSAVICEIFKRVGPKQNANPSEYLEDEPNCKKDSTAYEVNQYSVIGCQ